MFNIDTEMYNAMYYYNRHVHEQHVKKFICIIPLMNTKFTVQDKNMSH